MNIRKQYLIIACALSASSLIANNPGHDMLGGFFGGTIAAYGMHIAKEWRGLHEQGALAAAGLIALGYTAVWQTSSDESDYASIATQIATLAATFGLCKYMMDQEKIAAEKEAKSGAC